MGKVYQFPGGWEQNEYLTEGNLAVSEVLAPSYQNDSFLVEQSGVELQASRQRFCRSVLASLSEEPVEDGIAHEGERLISAALVENSYAPEWIQDLFIRRVCDSTAASSILRLLARLPVRRIAPWGYILALGGLANSDIQVREAAVRALESWGGTEALEALTCCVDNERIGWLKQYMKDVVAGIHG